MIKICDELTRDERSVLEALQTSSRRFRKGKPERICLLFYAFANYEGWDRPRFDKAIHGLKKKERVMDMAGIRKFMTIEEKEPDPKNIVRQERVDRWKRCAYCKRQLTVENVTRDHVIPKSRGGTDSDENIVGCCATCNTMKGDKTPSEWARSILDYRKPTRNAPSKWARYALRCSILLELLLGR